MKAEVDLEHSDFDLVLVVEAGALKELLGSQPLHQLKQIFLFQLLIEALRDAGVLVFEISKARVPLLSICFKQKLWIDLSLAVVQDIDSNPRNLLPEDEGSEVSLRSVNVSMTLFDSVNQCCLLDSHYQEFAVFLKFIKTWAINRQIYGQTYCFLGGVSWSILCASTYQMLRKSQESISLGDLVSNFFNMYSKWDWTFPVSLNPS